MMRLTFCTAAMILTVVISGAEEGYVRDRWGELVESMTKGVGHTSKLTAVVRGSVNRVVPEISGTRVRKVYLLVTIDRVMKPYSIARVNPPELIEEGKKEFLEWPELKKGDVLCVECPRGFKLDQIGKNTRVVMPVTAAPNRFKKWRSPEAEDERLNEKEFVERVADYGLQNIPAEAIWAQLADYSLLRSCAWDEFFKLVEQHAYVLGLLEAEIQARLKSVAAIKIEEDKEQIQLHAQGTHVSMEVRMAVAERFLQAGDARALAVYASVLDFLANTLGSDKLAVTFKGQPIEWHQQHVTDLFNRIPVVVHTIRTLLSAKELDADKVELPELMPWLTEMSKTGTIKYDEEKKKYVIKLKAQP